MLHLGAQVSGEAGSGSGGTLTPVYFPQFTPQPPPVTAKIGVIYGLTLAVQMLLAYLYDESSVATGPVQDLLRQVGICILLVSLLPALSGVVVDRPQSLWNRRWLYLTYIGCLLVWACDIGWLYLRL